MYGGLFAHLFDEQEGNAMRYLLRLVSTKNAIVSDIMQNGYACYFYTVGMPIR